MNIFFHWKTKEGRRVLVTPKLDNNLVFPGTTRDITLVKIL